jgi:hypothetical protein
MKIYEIDTGNLTSVRGSTVIQMVEFQELKNMYNDFMDLPVTELGFSDKNKFKGVHAGLILNIIKKYKLED